MCGIGGIADVNVLPLGTQGRLQAMADVMEHRGPDDEGFYLHRHVGLAARRLSIIDVDGGHQPVRNEDGTVHAVLNGEIYNFRELRRDLESRGHRFRAATDTEVLVHLYEEYGSALVDKLRGIFGFAILDERTGRLTIGRDRLGVKPLYYAVRGGVLVFGSEIKTMLASGLVDVDIDMESLGLLLTIGYVPSPRTIYGGVAKLPPAHTLVWDRGEIRLHEYWHFPSGQDTSLRDDREWQAEFSEALQAAVNTELVSDVPLGIMLSGGIDSSAITALVSQGGQGTVESFHIGFAHDVGTSEVEDARLVAHAFNTNHHEMLTDLEDGIDFLTRIVWHMDEPMSDLSALGFYRISAMAREHVTVALAGQGADELLAGYRRYAAFDGTRWARSIPSFVYDDVLAPMASHLPRAGTLKKAIRTVGQSDFFKWYQQSISMNGSELRDVLVRRDRSRLHTDEILLSTIQSRLAGFTSKSDLSRLLVLDAKMALPDSLLTYFDKMSMANSLEVRVPFLDYPLVELCTRMPDHMKLRGSETKRALRQAFRGVLPDETLAKRKKGFFVEYVNGWMRTEMRPAIEELLLRGDAKYADYLDSGAVKSMLGKHMDGREDYGRQLMNICMLELAAGMFVDGSIAAPSSRVRAPLRPQGAV